LEGRKFGREEGRKGGREEKQTLFYTGSIVKS